MHKKKDITRRNFIKKAGKGAGIMTIAPIIWNSPSIDNLTNKSIKSHIYMAKDYGPEKNIEMIIDMLGGINHLFGIDDIVIFKTNAQWFNQGSPNLAALKRIIELIIGMPGFRGEVIIADNNHSGRWPWNFGAWNTNFELNSDVPGVNNLNDLIDFFHKQSCDNVTSCHWIDADKGAKRVYSPEDGDGYFYATDLICNNEATGEDYRETIMTYPLFISSYSGTIIDLAKGAYQNGNYTDQPVKLINFSALCSHGGYTGATSAIKNYLGVSDLSGGHEPGSRLMQNYYNFHSFPFDGAGPGPVPGMLGKEIGMFLKTVRSADLNITTAEWVGWQGRTDITKAAQTKTILACADPVTLDYFATKYVLYPAGKANNSYYGEKLNPDQKDLPLRQYLDRCHEFGIGTLNEEEIEVHTTFPTPVQIISFTAKIIENDVELICNLSVPDNCYGFEVQKSHNDLNFYKISFVSLTNSSAKCHSCRDKNLSPGLYCYRLKLIDKDGTFEYSDTLLVDIKNFKVFSLLKNYPNPFNSVTEIRYGIPKAGNVTLSILDMNGRMVKTLLNEEKNTGYYSIKWDGKDKYNMSVPSGVYICQMNMAGFAQSIKIVLVR